MREPALDFPAYKSTRLRHPKEPLVRVGLEHDALDARLLQQERQRESGRSGADDPDLRSHPVRHPIGCAHRAQRFA